jgi:hypothetical protein
LLLSVNEDIARAMKSTTPPTHIAEMKICKSEMGRNTHHQIPRHPKGTLSFNAQVGEPMLFNVQDAFQKDELLPYPY